MTAPNADQIMGGYLSRLEAGLVSVPNARRQELMDDLRAHIAEARRRLPNESDADLQNILERLGDPAELAAAEIGRTDPPVSPRGHSRVLEVSAIVLLLVFWPVGVVLLWLSKAWSTRDKVIGTFLPPGGYFGTFVLGGVLALGALGTTCRTVSNETGRVLSTSCPTSGVQTGLDIGLVLIAVIYLIGPLLGAAYLATRLRRLELVPASDAEGEAVTRSVDTVGSH